MARLICVTRERGSEFSAGVVSIEKKRSHNATNRFHTIDWQKQGPKHESDIKEMTGYFWKTRDANAFGAYTPSLGTGLYHIADEAISPGMKLWSYGVGDDRAWATLRTSRRVSANFRTARRRPIWRR